MEESTYYQEYLFKTLRPKLMSGSVSAAMADNELKVRFKASDDLIELLRSEHAEIGLKAAISIETLHMKTLIKEIT